MSNTLEYIDAYFQKALSEEEAREFETRCTADEEFAKEVAYYVTARQSARQALLAQKQQQWQKAFENASRTSAAPPVLKPAVNRWVTYAAAACVILIIAAALLFQPQTPAQLAEQYIQDDYTQLSKLMDASADSIQMGLDAYNKKDYTRALSYFEGVRALDTTNTDAITSAGLSYLQLKDYDNALKRFDELSSFKNLRSNNGHFLKAITLLQRNEAGDKEEAKQLLETIVSHNEAGNSKAKELLSKW